MSSANESVFTATLIHWDKTQNHREMPWKGEKDPYKIWLSEVILQQTRVAQGLAYYNRFIEAYPTLAGLAAAPDGAVFRLWEGLGYYSRCRNLLYTARYLVNEKGGQFPDDYEGLLALKGVGPYTAAAIASFAFGLPEAVVDGNVYRVLSRVFGIDTPIDLPEAKNVYNPLAQRLLHKQEPGSYNQAIMDFGATVCTPQSPHCGRCPLSGICVALSTGRVNQLPVKVKRLERKHRYFLYLILQWQDNIYLQQRPQGDIWASLYEPYLLEVNSVTELSRETAAEILKEQLNVVDFRLIAHPVQKQLLTHQQLSLQFMTVQLPERPVILPETHWYEARLWSQLPKPQQIAQFLKNSSAQASLW